MIEYDIVWALSQSGLVNLVSNRLAVGWEPLGGPVFSPESSGRLLQAMTRKKLIPFRSPVPPDERIQATHD